MNDVNPERYLSNPEEREEAGTPHLIADVKMGLAMNLKQSFGELTCAYPPNIAAKK